MAGQQDTGKLGEKLAADYLQKKGYKLIACNYRHKRNEIDLIVRDKELLVFVEVKARSGNADFGFPEEAVNRHKARRVMNCASAYIFKTNWQGDIRFDIISVELGTSVKITHFEDAFH